MLLCEHVNAEAAQKSSDGGKNNSQGGPVMLIQKPACRKAAFGFTLIELMITVAIIAILAAVALPSYASYVRKQKIRAAQGDLAGLVLMMENRFQQQLKYPDTTTTTAATQATFTGWSPAQAENFTFIIAASSTNTTPQAYTLSATGLGTLAGCTISLTKNNTRTTSGCITGSSGWQ